MAESFVVYIDESGDEGFQFEHNGTGSSEWFVLSAVVVRAHNDGQIRRTLAGVRQTLRRPDNYALHFRKLKHEPRIAYVLELAKIQIRTVNVLVYKPLLKEPETFRNYRLYHYCVRLLIERVSWLCRDERQKSYGDGSARIVFSNRSAMSYEDLRIYVGKLLNTHDPLEVRIERSVIKPELIEARSHEQYAGLQAADADASSFFFAANRHRLGFTEPRYVQCLSPTLYRNSKQSIGYGLKFWPTETDVLIAKDPNLRWVKDFFEKK